KNRRSFTPEYKDEAARMVVELSRSVASVARELGINEQTLRECPHSAAECGDYCDPGDGQAACEACCDFDCKGNPEGARMCKTKCRGPYR
ncbi:MAG: transposase, partial [Pseudonocardiaceae bacterium]